MNFISRLQAVSLSHSRTVESSRDLRGEAGESRGTRAPVCRSNRTLLAVYFDMFYILLLISDHKLHDLCPTVY